MIQFCDHGRLPEFCIDCYEIDVAKADAAFPLSAFLSLKIFESLNNVCGLALGSFRQVTRGDCCLETEAASIQRAIDELRERIIISYKLTDFHDIKASVQEASSECHMIVMGIFLALENMERGREIAPSITAAMLADILGRSPNGGPA